MSSPTSTVTLAGAITRAPDGSLRPAPPDDISIVDLPIPNGYILNITRFHLAIILGISATAAFFVLLYGVTTATKWYCLRIGQQGGSNSNKTPPVAGACESGRTNTYSTEKSTRAIVLEEKVASANEH